jgi:RNA polymerase sigma-70 factor (ECF subfamily)
MVSPTDTVSVPCRRPDIILLSSVPEEPSGVDQRGDPPDSDAGLVARIRAGDPSAETELYQRFEKSVSFMLRERTRNAAQAADLCHDTFVILLKRLREEGIREPEKLSAYVHRTAHYVYVGSARDRGRHPEAPLPDDPPDRGARPADEDERRRSAAIVRRLIAALPVARDREILRRFYLEEQEKDTICRDLALSAAHFDRVISRARLRFRHVLETLGVNPRDLLPEGRDDDDCSL